MKIILNSKETNWDRKVINYSDVLSLLGLEVTEAIYTVTYFKGYLSHPEGILSSNNNYVRAKDKMIINCLLTNNA